MAGIVAALALIGAVGTGNAAAERPAASDAGGEERKRSASPRPALEVVQDLSIEKLVGQRVIVSYGGKRPPGKLFDLLRSGQAAGVIFFGANVDTDKGLIRRVIRRMQQARDEAAPRALQAPLLMMTDQEGGLVRRIPGGPLRSEERIGEVATGEGIERARDAGEVAAKTLASVGVNVNLAPVLGVLRPGSSFLGQFQRAYSGFPHRNGKLGRAFINALQGRGVAATSKHFPGLGAATEAENTDAGPVTLDLSLETLEGVDEVPYPYVIGAGTKLVMLSNATYPALDPDRPAGLSPTIIRGELRQRLGYGGVTITDALEAGGLEDFGPIPHRAVLAAGAGADLLLFSKQAIGEGIQGSRALRRSLRSGRLQREPFERAAARVLRLRRQLSVDPSSPLP